MTQWNQYIDDSATHGMIFDNKLRPMVPKGQGFLPVTSAGSVIIDSSAEANILFDLISLKLKIMRNMGLLELPEIHMRLMWGKTLPRRNKGKPNPYLGASLQDRFTWSREALSIISKYSREGALYVASGSIEIEDYQISTNRTNLHPDIILERQIIEAKFGALIQEYYKIMFNPLIELIINLMIVGDMFAKERNCDIKVSYDTTDASKGFSASDLYETVRPHGYFSKITQIEESSVSKHSLIELADVISYTKNRFALGKYRKKTFIKWFPDYALQELFIGIGDGIQEAHRYVDYEENFRNYVRPKAIIIALYFVKLLKELDPAWVNEHVIDFDESSRFIGMETESSGLTSATHILLRPEIVEEYKNGKRQL